MVGKKMCSMKKKLGKRMWMKRMKNHEEEVGEEEEEVGGEEGAGVSVSSSSSSPHSSSLRGVMLLPSQTEWIDT